MPLSDCEVRDPRIRRTRQLLQGALRNLMQKKSFDEISVQDITEAATVNRATFYDHYTDKFALLDALVAGGFHKLLDEREVKYDGTCASKAGAIILATCDYLSQCHEGQTACQRQSAFEPLIEAAITKSIRRILIAGMPREGRLPLPTPEMIATTASWAIYGAVKEWCSGAGRPPAEDMVPQILQLVVPILNASDPSHAQAPSPLAHGE